METLRKHIVVPKYFHKALKKLALEKESSMEAEIIRILNKEFEDVLNE